MMEQLVLATVLFTGSVKMNEPAALSTVNHFQDSNTAVWLHVPKWVRELGMCVREHESHHRYRAKNPTSSASGAYQFIRKTWSGNARWTKVAGVYVARQYKTARQAPAWVQDAVFIHAITQGGIKAWAGTGCKGT